MYYNHATAVMCTYVSVCVWYDGGFLGTPSLHISMSQEAPSVHPTPAADCVQADRGRQIAPGVLVVLCACAFSFSALGR